jgi:hypothetical protein
MKRGRKTLCDAALTKKVCAVLEKAQTIASACAVSGIGTTTYHSWIGRGEAGEAGFAEFAVSCGRARAKAKQKLTDIILKAAPDDWKAAAWLLEKLYPNEYGKAWRGEPDLQPGPGEPTTVILNVQRDAESDAAAKLFGKRPER